MSNASTDPSSRTDRQPIVKPLILIVVSILGGLRVILPIRWESLPIISGRSPSFIADSISLPPIRREFASHQREYVFVVINNNRWKSGQVQGELFQVTGKERTLLWARKLPHFYGPRYGLVTDRGDVLLVDEWIHHPNDYTLLLFDRENSQVARYSFQRLLELMKIDRFQKMTRTRDLERAIVGQPSLDDRESRASLELLGKMVSIDLNTGNIILP
jgi:hypothetical protein